MEVKKECADRHIEGNEKHLGRTFASSDQIDDIFLEAETAEMEKGKRNVSSIQSDGASEFENRAAYPEECCDATEISDEDYERWEEGSKNGFWRTFIENR